LAWARANDIPTLCSCLATHAVLASCHGQQRAPIAPKVWGVYGHRQVARDHPLLRGLPAEIPVPHSRHNEVSAAQFAAAGYDVLLASDAAGVHLAVERERGRRLLLQGHPEYEAVSLLKEYTREVRRWRIGERAEYPALPAGYFGADAAEILATYRQACLGPEARADQPLPFPEAQLTPRLKNTWTAAAVQITSNWLAEIGVNQGGR